MISLSYALFIKNIGFFHLGRFIDLLQFDIITILLAYILYYEIKRWKRLQKMDKGE